MRITSSYFKIKTKRGDSTELARFFMRSKDMLHINNEVGSKHVENILTTAIDGIGLAGFTCLSGNLSTSHSNITANKC
jgi:hypothetical protein